MRLSIIRFSLLLLCAGVLATPAAAQEREQQPSRGDPKKLTRVEITEGGSSIATAREAVRLLRPQWLTPPLGKIASSDIRGSGGGAQTVIVYIDDIKQPDLEQSLAMVPASRIVEMKYLDQVRAVMLRGPGHEAGVIEITTIDKRK